MTDLPALAEAIDRLDGSTAAKADLLQAVSALTAEMDAARAAIAEIVDAEAECVAKTAETNRRLRRDEITIEQAMDEPGFDVWRIDRARQALAKLVGREWPEAALYIATPEGRAMRDIRKALGLPASAGAAEVVERVRAVAHHLVEFAGFVRHEVTCDKRLDRGPCDCGLADAIAATGVDWGAIREGTPYPPAGPLPMLKAAPRAGEEPPGG